MSGISSQGDLSEWSPLVAAFLAEQDVSCEYQSWRRVFHVAFMHFSLDR